MAGKDSNTILLLHCDGTDGSTSFPDVSNSNLTVTTQGTAHVDHDQQKFGNASLFVDGDSDALNITYDSVLNIGGGDFTIDCWVWNISIPGVLGYIFSEKPTANGSEVRFYVISNSGIAVHVGDKLFQSGADVATTGSWVHYAMEHYNDTVYLYVDGIRIGSASTSGTNWANTTQDRVIGSGSTTQDRYLHAYVDEYRISNIARYGGVASFTPPIRQYSKAINLAIITN